MQSQKQQGDFCLFPRHTIQYHCNPCPDSNTEEAEVEWFYEDLQDLLELTPTKRCPFHQRGLEYNSRKSRDRKSGVTDKFGLEIQSEAGQKLTVLLKEHTGHRKHIFQ